MAHLVCLWILDNHVAVEVSGSQPKKYDGTTKSSPQVLWVEYTRKIEPQTSAWHFSDHRTWHFLVGIWPDLYDRRLIKDHRWLYPPVSLVWWQRLCPCHYGSDNRSALITTLVTTYLLVTTVVATDLLRLSLKYYHSVRCTFILTWLLSFPSRLIDSYSISCHARLIV